MARPGTRVEEVIDVVGHSAGDTNELLLNIVSDDSDYRVVEVSTGRFSFARSVRPTWSIVATVLTVWILGLGLMFLLVKKTETFLAVVESDHRGVRVRIQGTVTTTMLGAIRTALESTERDALVMTPTVGVPAASVDPLVGVTPSPDPGGLIDAGAPPVPPVPSVPPAPSVPASSLAPPAPPVPPAPSADAPPSIPASQSAPSVPVAPSDAAWWASDVAPRADMTSVPEVTSVERRPEPTQGNPTPPAAPPETVDDDMDYEPTITVTPSGMAAAADGRGTRVVLDDGRTFIISGLTIIGRDPAHDRDLDDQGRPVRLVALDDQTRSVSKTHLAIMPVGADFEITDLQSTNGVSLLGDYSEIRLEPGVPMLVHHGQAISFGNRTLRFDEEVTP